MSAPLFILVTDAESLADVAVNIAQIEVIEARDDGTRAWIGTAQHAVVVNMTVAQVCDAMREVVPPW